MNYEGWKLRGKISKFSRNCMNLKELGQFFGKLGNFSKFVAFVCVCVFVGGGSEYIEVPGKKSKTLN